MQPKHKNISIFIPHLGCPNNCSFCNQCVISGQQQAPTIQEVENTLQEAMKDISDKANTQIAFFGGSFTAIAYDYMVSLLDTASRYVGVGKFNGIRISTRPDAITTEILDVLKRYRVTAIELGAQSMRDDVLVKNDRGHTSNDVVQASKLIKQRGFSLGLQMMVGLYGDDERGSYYTANRIIELQPDTVRIYPTVVLDGTKLAHLMQSGEYKIMSIESAVSICADLLMMFKQNSINVIRLGLHASLEVEGEMIGGIYHPAFGELCEGEIYYKLALEKLSDLLNCDKSAQKNVWIEVSNRSISKMIGQKKINLIRLKDQGINAVVKGSDKLDEYEIIIRNNT